MGATNPLLTVVVKPPPATKERIETLPGVRAAVYGLLAAVLVGALTNDSGPIILLIGSSYLLFVAVYLAAVPGPGARTAATKGSRPLAADSR